MRRTCIAVVALAMFLAGAPAAVAADWPSATPSGLAQYGAGSSSVTMTWTKVPKAAKYRLQISTSASMSGATYKRTTKTTETITGLKSARGYYVKVRVITKDGINRSAYSGAVRAWTTFAVPTGLKVEKRDASSITFDWKDVPGAPRYRIQIADNAQLKGSTFHRFWESTGTVTGLSAGRTYYARARVITDDGLNLSNYSPAIVSKPAPSGGGDDGEEEPTTPPPATPPPSGGSKPLTVASFNVRCANCYKKQNLERPWSERRATVVSTILEHEPDVIGIQEASQGWLKSGSKKIDLSQFEDLRNRLRSGGTPYEVTNKHRNNCVKSTTPSSCKHKDQGASQGTKVFFNTDTVKLVSQGSQKLPQCSGCNERYVAWAVLEQKSTGDRFFFANSHLEATSKYYALRKSQTKAMMDEVEMRRPKGMPAFVVGDFNSTRYATPTNAPYDEIVSHGFVDPLGHTYKSPKISSTATAEKRIRANYNSHNNFVRTVPKYASNENGSNLDYIFTTKMRTLEWETVMDLDSSGKIAGVIPSDHNMLVAKVLLP